MTAVYTSSDFKSLIGDMPNGEVLRLAQYLNDVRLPLQTRSENGQHSRLLQLPQELRDNIVRAGLPAAISVDPYGVSQETATPAWFQVCSQMRLDAAKVYFRTPIQLPYLSDEKFKGWVDSIDVSYRSFVRSIQIDRFIPDLDGAIEYARGKDTLGGFRPGTIWATTSFVEDDNAVTVWINARGQTKPYSDVCALELEHKSGDSEEFNCWD
ncbi:uncharacterized protein K489DRAFT_405699 [Dissoconium aciculare CBS 342.82]|uniref:Uncharacterized protein n=1 Tax=Dissoconium aciculare CBS 342.82 TaxID=1314786 RepID=A0A6J3MGX4_9PEZI|nr:uncharacterized protein K489DRAFT_405699 [Dissoconium aciculare CBS 342.82]KAF1826939.1 hypothetical protein K489DRAFT_405699 [Dissoconium aciculare CBS 342.82]